MVGPVGWAQHDEEQDVDLTNLSETSIENVQEKECLTNLSGEKENALSATTDKGINSNKKAHQLHSNSTPKKGGSTSRSLMSLYGKDDHKRLAKSLGYVLNQGNPSDWHGFTIILLARATEAEIAALAYAALQALDHDTAYMTASAALFGTLNGEAVA